MGGRITQQVEKELEPVRALELKNKMQQGVGGVTIVTYQPEGLCLTDEYFDTILNVCAGKQFIITNSITYTCDGTIDITSGKCSGTLEPFKINTSSPEPEWCYVRNVAWVNNNLCLSTGPMSVQIINNIIECSGSSPILRLTREEYNNLCNSHSQKVEFRYISDVNNYNHVDIPNNNKYVKCDNEEANLCVFTENWLTNSQIIVNN